MEDFVKNLANGEGWTDATTVGVLSRTLGALVGMGIGREDVEAIIRREGGVVEPARGDDGPEVGDVVRMRKHDARIVVAEVPKDQAQRAEGIWWIIDDQGDNHRIERDGDDEPWYAIVG